MVNLVPSGAAFAIDQTMTYEFNKAEVAAFYDDMLNPLVAGTNPTVTCTGSSTNCASLNQPATPTAPDPSLTHVQPVGCDDVLCKMRCLFLNGGTLDTIHYDQAVKNVSGLNGKGNWTFTFYYTITPVASLNQRA